MSNNVRKQKSQSYISLVILVKSCLELFMLFRVWSNFSLAEKIQKDYPYLWMQNIKDRELLVKVGLQS